MLSHAVLVFIQNAKPQFWIFPPEFITEFLWKRTTQVTLAISTGHTSASFMSQHKVPGAGTAQYSDWRLCMQSFFCDSCCNMGHDKKKYSLYKVLFSKGLCICITFLKITGRSLALRLWKVVLMDTVLLPAKDSYHSLILPECTWPSLYTLVTFLKKWT